MNTTPQLQWKRLLASGLLVCLLILPGLLLSSCGPRCRSQVPALLDGADPTLIDKSVITHEPCAPPCWQGLMPRQSTDEEVLVTLKDLPFVDQSSIVYSEGYAISWHSSLSNSSADRFGIVSLDEDGFVILVSTPLEYELTLQELISSLGPPDLFAISRTRRSNCHWASMYWLEAGLEAETHLGLTPQDGQVVTPDTLVSIVTYFRSATNVEDYLTSIIDLESDMVLEQSQDFHEWDGYESVNISVFSQE